MATRPLSDYFAPVLLVLGTALAAGNWYLQPGRAMAWIAALLLFGCMTAALLLAGRRSKGEAAHGFVGSITSAVAFAGLILVIALAAKLAAALGAIQDADLSRRTTQVIMGAFLVYIGNAMPKTLTPLSALQCDAVRVQAFQRFAGWTWVLTGLGFAAVWLVLPLDLAKPVSLVLLGSGMLLIGWQIVRLRWPGRADA